MAQTTPKRNAPKIQRSNIAIRTILQQQRPRPVLTLPVQRVSPRHGLLERQGMEPPPNLPRGDLPGLHVLFVDSSNPARLPPRLSPPQTLLPTPPFSETRQQQQQPRKEEEETPIPPPLLGIHALLLRLPPLPPPRPPLPPQIPRRSPLHIPSTALRLRQIRIRRRRRPLRGPSDEVERRSGTAISNREGKKGGSRTLHFQSGVLPLETGTSPPKRRDIRRHLLLRTIPPRNQRRRRGTHRNQLLFSQQTPGISQRMRRLLSMGRLGPGSFVEMGGVEIAAVFVFGRDSLVDSAASGVCHVRYQSRFGDEG
mmetsp:Transcript_21186/g.44383  ORF Transcript_21186/g.44383 Transcript_21186/m.44383 type:complete len:311 (-) Transcript_21186:445-1377(-)